MVSPASTQSSQEDQLINNPYFQVVRVFIVRLRKTVKVTSVQKLAFRSWLRLDTC